jgi:2',3'-cyclic-nucleotide 2'-phosphodiesterase (5'-nucleotidase family)
MTFISKVLIVMLVSADFTSCTKVTPQVKSLDVKPVTVVGKNTLEEFKIEILHFNDAYNIDKAPPFVTKWKEYMTPDTLKLFSGDIYSPSNLSSDFYGSQFKDFLDIIELNAGVVGNHEFDYGEDRFIELAKMNPKYQWLNSNLIHKAPVIDPKATSDKLVKPVETKKKEETLDDILEDAFEDDDTSEKGKKAKTGSIRDFKKFVDKKADKQLNGKISDYLKEFLLEKREQLPIGRVPTHKIYKIGDVKIGVFGMADTNWLTSSHLKPGTYELEKPEKCAARMGEYLRKKRGCHLVIALTHMNNSSDKDVLKEKNYVDFILGGHEHMYYQARVNGKFVLKSGADFSHFSKLTVTKSKTAAKETGDWAEGTEFEIGDANEPKPEEVKGKETEQVKEPKKEKIYPSKFVVALKRDDYYLNVEIERVKIQKNGAQDAAMRESLDKLMAKLPKLDTEVFQLISELDGREDTIRSQETRICNWVTDLLRLHSETDMAMLSSGGFRLAGILPANAKVTIGNIRTLLPFPDEIMKITMKGEKVIEFLEQGIKAKLNSKPIMAVSGITCKYDPKKEYPNRVDVDSIRLDGVPLDKTRSYTMAVTKFVAGGKDGFDLFAGSGIEKVILESITPVSAIKKAWEDAQKPDIMKEFLAFRKLNPTDSIDEIAKGKVVEDKTESKGPVVDQAKSQLSGKKVETNSSTPQKKVQQADKKELYYSLFAGTVKNKDGKDIWTVNFVNPVPRVEAVTKRNLVSSIENL